MNKKFKQEHAFFLRNGERTRFCVNEQCKACVYDCKQSFRADVLACPIYISKRTKNQIKGESDNARAKNSK